MFGFFKKRPQTVDGITRYPPKSDIRVSTAPMVEIYQTMTQRVAHAYQIKPDDICIELRLFAASFILRFFHAFGRFLPETHNAIAAIFYDRTVGVILPDPAELADPFYKRTKTYWRLIDQYWHAAANEKTDAFIRLAETFEGMICSSLPPSDLAKARAKLVHILFDQMEVMARIVKEI